MFEKHIYVERREKLKHAISDGLILLLGNDESCMNYKDNLYPFRQDSTFLYFVGIDQPGLAALIDVDKNEEVLFGDDFTVEQTVWMGFRESLSLVSDKIGVSMVKRKKDLFAAVAEALIKKRKVHFLPPYRPEHIPILESLLGIHPSIMQNSASLELIKAVIGQRSFKSPEEIAEINAAVNTTVDMQMSAIKMAKEGVTEAQIAGHLQSLAIGAGGNLSFPTILTMQGQILHNGFSKARLKEGRLILCDCGAETSMHYSGDLTRTFPVSKKFTKIQREIYDIVFTAHQAAVELLKPGILFRDIHLSACEKLVEGLQQMGLMKGDIKESVAMGAHALFFPCGLGHMMGLDVHDMENLGEKYVGYNESIKQSTQFGLKSLRLGKSLEEGFVITVEPGLYFNSDLIDEWEAEKRFDSFINYDRVQTFKDVSGIRIEEDFLITGTGKQLLGKQLAKTAQELEELMLL